jgi:hypothetical protein
MASSKTAMKKYSAKLYQWRKYHVALMWQYQPQVVMARHVSESYSAAEMTAAQCNENYSA